MPGRVDNETEGNFYISRAIAWISWGIKNQALRQVCGKCKYPFGVSKNYVGKGN